MRIFAILLFSIFLSCSNEKKTDCNYITDYYPNTVKAEVEFYLGNYDKAYEYYRKAFENCNAIKLGAHHDTDMFAKVCVELGKNDLALDYIEKTIEKGGTLNEFQSDSIFDKILKSSRGKKIIAEYDKKREEYLNSLNIELRNELQEMIAIDQSLVGKQRERDSIFKINDLRLVEIFEEFGYPNEQVIGNYGIDFTYADPTILLLHTDDSIR